MVFMKKKIITLRSCPKNYTYDQDKACSPRETVARFQERLQACRLDILQEIRRIDNGRLDIPVYFSLCGADARRIIGNKKQMGKGSTPEQAYASACMELGERFSFFSFIRDSDNFLVGDYDAMEAQGACVRSRLRACKRHDAGTQPRHPRPGADGHASERLGALL